MVIGTVKNALHRQYLKISEMGVWLLITMVIRMVV